MGPVNLASLFGLMKLSYILWHFKLARKKLYLFLTLLNLRIRLFKEHEKHPWRNVTFSKVAGCSLPFFFKNTPSWVFYTFFKIVQMVPNRSKHHI